METSKALEKFRRWYLYSCRRIAIHPLVIPAILLTAVFVLIVAQAPCMEPEEEARLYEMEDAERKARIRQLYAYHESRDPCDVQERVLLEQIDSAKTDPAGMDSARTDSP